MSATSSCFRVLAITCCSALIVFGLPATAWAKTYKASCDKGAVLQKVIDGAVSGDTIEISGICMGNITIRDKALTLTGSGPGPNGITGTAANTDGVRIENSRGTHFENLTISNPFFTGVRILFQSDVTMTDCTVSNISGGAGTAIWTHDSSYFSGTRLRLEGNLRGLGASNESRVWCHECDLLNNGSAEFGGWAASAWQTSQITLLDSVVTGRRGLDARRYSYIDIDCVSYTSPHDCSLAVSDVAALAFVHSTANLYEAGDFTGRLWALDHAEVQLGGARQTALSGVNYIDSASSLRVEGGSTGHSRLTGDTIVSGFSHALFYGADTVLDGSLGCDAGGDAWVEPGIDMSSYTVSGCDHAPSP